MVLVQRHSGAGIIPVRRKSGGLEILLGRERYVRDWVGSLRYSGLEGSVKGNESVEENAAREAFEESAGLLFRDPGEEAKELAAGHYLLKIEIEGNQKKHVTFLKVYDDIDDSFPMLFSETRGYLASFVRSGRRKAVEGSDGWRQMGGTGESTEPPNVACRAHPALKTVVRRSGAVEVVISEDFLEKMDVRWTSLDELRSALDGDETMKLRPMFTAVAEQLLRSLSDL